MKEEVLNAWSRATFLAQNAVAKDEYGDATNHYIDALNAAMTLKETAPIYCAETKVALAALSLMADEPELAITLLTDALPIYAQTYPRSHRKMLELYHLVANAHHHVGLYETARYWYELTLENMAHLPWNHVDKQVVAENFRQLLENKKYAA
ncbi:MAG: tetratricopeptide repeat protein [Cyanobacteria bacterium SZAS-4]|nr:tetratricopeptide repeat protein [Cyanobacteria bacterium SZAS-4]